MGTKFKRNKDGTIEGITTMGDLIPKEELTPEQEERRKIHEYYEKKYSMRPQKFEEYIKEVK